MSPAARRLPLLAATLSWRCHWLPGRPSPTPCSPYLTDVLSGLSTLNWGTAVLRDWGAVDGFLLVTVQGCASR
jgi:hypothetical protein